MLDRLLDDYKYKGVQLVFKRIFKNVLVLRDNQLLSAGAFDYFCYYSHLTAFGQFRNDQEFEYYMYILDTLASFENKRDGN